MGHNFGASHSFEEGVGRTGGIMDYGDGTLDGIFQFNTQYRRSEICRVLSRVVGQCGSITAFAAACGNGLLESGEACECDSGTSCRYCTDCRLDAGRQCTPDGPAGECCSASGDFRFPSTTCRVSSVEQGLCPNPLPRLVKPGSPEGRPRIFFLH